MGINIAFPQSSGHFPSLHTSLHSVCNISTETSSPALTISAVMLSNPGDLFFFNLFIDAVTSSVKKSPIPVEFVEGKVASTVLSVGFCSLYSVSKCSFHLLKIPCLSCIMLPCTFFTHCILSRNLPQSSFIVRNIL